ncbi:MAG: lysoplasmalogenase [Chitinophagales bacterium]
MPFFLPLIFLLALAAITVRHKNVMAAYDILKPLTTIAIIALPLIHLFESGGDFTYTILIGAALVFCLLGDVFLLREKGFVYGLAAFLVGHLVFVIASVYRIGIQFNPIAGLVVGAIAWGYFRYLKGQELGKYTLPVAVYILVIALMIVQYVSAGFTQTESIFTTLAFASVLFGFSDSVIAYTKFVKPLHIGQILILSTYWLSITLFALSVFHFG